MARRLPDRELESEALTALRGLPRACILSRGDEPRLSVIGQHWKGPGTAAEATGRVTAFPAPAPGDGSPYSGTPLAVAQQYRDQVDLQLVEHAGAQEGLREIGAVHHDVLVAGGLLGLPHGAFDPVGDVADELGGGLLGRLAARGRR